MNWEKKRKDKIAVIRFLVPSCTDQQLKWLFLHTHAVWCVINSEIVPLHMTAQQQLVWDHTEQKPAGDFAKVTSLSSLGTVFSLSLGDDEVVENTILQGTCVYGKKEFVLHLKVKDLSFLCVERVTKSQRHFCWWSVRNPVSFSPMGKLSEYCMQLHHRLYDVTSPMC